MRKVITKKIAQSLLGRRTEPSLGETVHIGNHVGMTRVQSGNTTRFALHGGEGKVNRTLADVV
jgi:hypothetical protein